MIRPYLPHLSAAALLLAGTMPAGASVLVPLTETRSGTGFQSFTMDPQTGSYYMKSTYDSSAQLTRYLDATAFLANAPQSTLTLAGPAFGPYVAVRNDRLYARAPDVTFFGSSSAPLPVAAWSLPGGARNWYQAQLGGVTGGNYGFNWGGGSNGNFMQDDTGLYYFGHTDSATQWSLTKVGPELQSLSSVTVDVAAFDHPTLVGRLGFGFMIGGELFTGPSYDDYRITARIDAATGAVTPVDFTIEQQPGNGAPYWSNAFYDPNSDTLFLNDTSANKLYRVADAAVAFGLAAPATTPEPATTALLGGALLLLAGLRRR